MRNIIRSKTSVILATIGLLVGSATVAIPALASDGGHFGLGIIGQFFAKTGNLPHPAIFGTVTAVSGNTVTVTSKNVNDNTSVVYTVDATNATITKGVGKNSTAIAVSGLAVNDNVIVFGTINGTSVTATSVTDFGVAPVKAPHNKKFIRGTVASVTDNTITVIGKDNVTYTVDATNAVIFKGSATPVTISSIVVGDKVVVFGTITNTTSVTATKIFDGQVKKHQDEDNENGHQGHGKGFFGLFLGLGEGKDR